MAVECIYILHKQTDACILWSKKRRLKQLWQQYSIKEQHWQFCVISDCGIHRNAHNALFIFSAHYRISIKCSVFKITQVLWNGWLVDELLAACLNCADRTDDVIWKCNMSRNASNESAANFTSSIQFFSKPYLAKKKNKTKKFFGRCSNSQK